MIMLEVAQAQVIWSWPELWVWVVAGVGLLAGVMLRSRLRRLNYRYEDEREAPARRVWWVPLATCVVAGTLAWQVSITPYTGAGAIALAATYLAFAVVGVGLAAIDLDVHRLPDAWVIPSFAAGVLALGLCSVLTGDFSAWVRAVMAALLFVATYVVLAVLSPGARGLGAGDIKLSALLGLALGWWGWASTLLGLYLAFVVGGLIALVLLCFRRVGLKGHLAFGPAMLIGAWLGIIVQIDVVLMMVFE